MHPAKVILFFHISKKKELKTCFELLFLPYSAIDYSAVASASAAAAS
jgi:hypothetical protein